MTAADYAHSGRVLLTMGYCMDFKISRLIGIATRKLVGMVKALFVTDRKCKTNTKARGSWLKQNPGRVTPT
jgi:hypothetical protein